MAKDDKQHENREMKPDESGAKTPSIQHGSAREGGAASEGGGKAETLFTSAALIGVGALLEPELLGGMLLGAGAVYAARSLPLVGGLFRPVARAAVKWGYAACARMNEVIAEASEDVQDFLAEARSEWQTPDHPGQG